LIRWARSMRESMQLTRTSATGALLSLAMSQMPALLIFGSSDVHPTCLHETPPIWPAARPIQESMAPEEKRESKRSVESFRLTALIFMVLAFLPHGASRNCCWLCCGGL